MSKHNVPIPEQRCERCFHFRQHYIQYDSATFHPIACGHCVYPMIKSRSPMTPACKHYKPCPPKHTTVIKRRFK